MRNFTKRLVLLSALVLPFTATVRAAAEDDYPINFPADAVITNDGRSTTGLTLESPSFANAHWGVMQYSSRLLYNNLLNAAFMARAGETVTPGIDFSYNGAQPWMHGYVFLDCGNDGSFDVRVNDDGTIPEGSDLMSYSHYQGKNSLGATTPAGTSIQPPAFVVPDLPNGYYRMRYKVDWDNIDPAGNNASTNLITANGGSIVDVRLNIHGETATVRCAADARGEVFVDGKKLEGTLEVPFGESFEVKVAPADENLRFAYLHVRHGYGLDGERLVHGTPQYVDECIPASLFRDGCYTLGDLTVDGDVLLDPVFMDADAVGAEEYGRNFPDDLAVERTDRKLNTITVTDAQSGKATTLTLDPESKLVYHDLTTKEVPVSIFSELSVNIDFTGHSMHHYLYVDLDNDGRFTPLLNADGTPATSGELVSYTYYDGKNSLGTTIEALPGEVSVDSIPTFTLPPYLNEGIYRARLVTDWNSIDAAGRWAEGGTNNIDANGGCVVDFLLNVKGYPCSLRQITRNGSIYGPSNTSLPERVDFFSPLTVVPTPVAAGYKAEKMTIRHGYGFDGPQYVHGNRQWSVYEVPAEAYTIPADSVNGMLEIEVLYAPTSEADYQLVFSDEFDEGSVPDPEKWTCSPRYSAAWNRFIVDDERVAFISNGDFVARAIPNPDHAKYEGDMITGAIQTSGGRFSFKYGKIEARIRTNAFRGNFPAFWLMPDDQRDGWPRCGEIDIWEQINTEQRAYHTLHTGYRQSMYSTNEDCNTDHYHTYGFEWDAEKMIWYLDGREVGRYNKSANYPAHPDSWPFDKAFYIILNQSVGNGSWAAAPNTSHTYETRFDWVRVYQTAKQTGIVAPVAAEKADIRLYDLQGRAVSKPAKGGVYVRGGRKIIF